MNPGTWLVLGALPPDFEVLDNNAMTCLTRVATDRWKGHSVALSDIRDHVADHSCPTARGRAANCGRNCWSLSALGSSASLLQRPMRWGQNDTSTLPRQCPPGFPPAWCYSGGVPRLQQGSCSVHGPRRLRRARMPGGVVDGQQRITSLTGTLLHSDPLRRQPLRVLLRSRP